jgi:hypothetical protein
MGVRQVESVAYEIDLHAQSNHQGVANWQTFLQRSENPAAFLSTETEWFVLVQ